MAPSYPVYVFKRAVGCVVPIGVLSGHKLEWPEPSDDERMEIERAIAPARLAIVPAYRLPEMTPHGDCSATGVIVDTDEDAHRLPGYRSHLFEGGIVGRELTEAA